MAHLAYIGTRSEAETPGENRAASLNAARPVAPTGRIERWLSAIVILSGLTLWEIAARAGWIAALFFPPPSLVLQTLGRMAIEGDLWPALGITLYRLLFGLAIGVSAGLVVGWVMGTVRVVRVTLDPIVAVLHPIPKLAIFPLFLIMLGIGETSKIVLIATTAFFPMLINTLAGVQQIDPIYWEVATNYGASGRTLLRRLILPGSLPMALVGLRLAINSAMIITIAVEMLSTQQGLGAQIWLAWQTLRIGQLYAILVVIALLGGGFNVLLARCSVWFVPWQTARIR